MDECAYPSTNVLDVVVELCIWCFPLDIPALVDSALYDAVSYPDVIHDALVNDEHLLLDADACLFCCLIKTMD
ncbi:MAG TPA: hypothetical protein O0X23_02620 [Methanocorpusculum sp.]|nr:hypothetical protein [Methanocorpusculum sp.]